MIIDVDRLREYLTNYYGSAMSYYPVAVMDLTKIESASDEELINIALQNNVNLSNFEIKQKRKYL